MGTERYPYTYEIQETPGSLVITWHGSKLIGFFIFRVIFTLLMLLFWIYTFYTEIIITPGSAKELFICAGIFLALVMIYFLFTSSIPLNLLLSEEVIKITEDSIEMTRSGFGSLVRHKQFPISGNTVITSMSQILGPKYLHFYNPSFDRYFKSIPMYKVDVLHQSFCFGITYTDSQVILERIKTKFPRIKLS
jgi:hypothetical protein